MEKVHRIAGQRCLTIVLTGCAALGWWGALYPQFTLLSGTYGIICEENIEESVPGNAVDAEKEEVFSEEREPDKRELYWRILDADRSQIRVKSRILEDWKALLGAGSE